MQSKVHLIRLVPLAVALALALAVAGCSTFTGGGGSEPETTSANATQPGQIDPRRYLGPNYCPELRIPEGMQLVRTYEAGGEGDPDTVLWQASLGETARECLYDLEDNLTLRVGVSGRVIAGPKGGPGTVTVPVRIAVVKHKEAVLFSELFPIAVTIPALGSTAFTEVREVVVPSPGTSTDYILYVALREKDIDWLNPVVEEEPVVAIVEEPIAALEEAAPAPAPQPPPPAAATTPNELPVPSGGFVLGQ
jgi:hypothetical protein